MTSTAAAPASSVDSAVQRVAEEQQRWRSLRDEDRAELLAACAERLSTVAPRWVATACAAKGMDPAGALAGEEWISGPAVTARHLRQYHAALTGAADVSAEAISHRPDGQIVARVLPADSFDRLLLAGYEADLWIQPGRTASRLTRGPGGVAAVLGAGNVASIAPTDVLWMLLARDQVVVLKMNPVNDYLGPFLSEAFQPLVDAGFLAFVYGGADVGQELCHHPDVDSIHLTGSHRTYDALVWGSDPGEQARRKSAGDPVLSKEVSAELGCVTPILVVPGHWSEGDLRFQARNVAATVAHNASFNCNAGKVLVTAADWTQREAFLEAVRKALRHTPTRHAYYPGAEQRWRRFLDCYRKAEVLTSWGDGAVPWTLVPGVPPRPGELALQEEAWCGVLAETALDAAGPEDFLAKAVAFANEQVWGNLSCMILAHPKTPHDALDRAVAELHYGGIAVNCWAGVLFGLGTTSWGAFPGNTPENIQSGVGVVHNTLFFDHPEKSVVVTPFRLRPKPVYFADHRRLATLGRRLTRFERRPTWWRVPGLVVPALLG